MIAGTLDPAVIARSVWAVPPLALTADLTVNDAANRRLLGHIAAGGVTTVLYGGNANVYGFTAALFQEVAEAAADWAAADAWVIPSVGPDWGKLMDHAAVLARLDYPAAMALPMFGPSDPAGIERALRTFVDRAGIPLIVYIRATDYLPPVALGRLVADGTVFALKYAAPRPDPAVDPYLQAILEHVPASRVVSGFGEPPALPHMETFGLAGFTAGCVCIAPRRSIAILAALRARDFDTARDLMRPLRDLEALRDTHGPIPVIHAAVALAGVAETGPILPMISDVDPALRGDIEAAATSLLAAENQFTA